MAFPWNVIRSANLASGEIVEDLKLGLDLALAGYPPQFCPLARVYSVFPSSAEGHDTQRQRWEKGHIVTIVSSAPRLLIKSLVSRNWGLLFLTLNLMIPPLSLFSLVLIGGLLIGTLIFIGGGSSAALLMSIANAIFFGLALIACWVKFGRDTLPAHALPSIAYYVLGKLPLYKRIFTGKSVASWIRTDRDHVPPKAQRNHDPEK
jgi:cellulose synthase/poly-beta-1,6-N-acetylglucosamine synthase-like glycosyltransferase